MTVSYHAGTAEVDIGDQFEWIGGNFQVVGFKNERMYSPVGLGGTPIIEVVLVSGACRGTWIDSEGKYREYAIGEIIDFCGDSVAAFVAESKK